MRKPDQCYFCKEPGKYRKGALYVYCLKHYRFILRVKKSDTQAPTTTFYMPYGHRGSGKRRRVY